MRDVHNMKDEKKAINDLFFICKGILYDSDNARVSMLIFRKVNDKNASEFEE